MAALDLGDQARLQQQIIEALSRQTAQLEEQEEILSRQVALGAKLRDALSGGDSDAGGSQFEHARDAAEAAAEASDRAGESAGRYNQRSIESAAASKEAAAETGILESMYDSLSETLSSVADRIQGVVSAIGNTISSIYGLAESIIAIPLGIWNSFLDLLDRSGGGSTALAQAKEEVREAFGKLSSGAGKDVMNMYHRLNDASSELAKSGLRLTRIFGRGQEGLAARLKFVAEIGKSLGTQLHEVTENIGRDIGKIVYGIKAMNVTNEEAGQALLFFHNAGMNASKTFQEMSGTAAMLAKQTGFSIKSLGKSMIETTKHFPQFAKQGVKALALVADYTHRLNISVQALKGVYDAFDSFEAAAESSSKLSQAFGIQIDAMEMVKEQSPVKRMEMLRDAFKQTGRSLNDLSTAERKHLLESMHISEEDAERVLGENNKKKAMSESEKAAKAAADAARDQKQVMKELADAIKRIVPDGSQGLKWRSMWAAFTDGFMKGIERSHEFRALLHQINAAFSKIYWLGRDVAQMFLKQFPGVQTMFKGLMQYFNPDIYERFANRLREVFGKFFEDIKSDPKKGAFSFITAVKDAFMSFFGERGEGEKTIMEGGKTFLKTLGGIAAGVLQWIMKSIQDGIKAITAFIKSPKKLAAAGGLTDIASDGAAFFQEVFGPLIDTFMTEGKEILKALGDMFSALWNDVLKPWFKELWEIRIKPALIDAWKEIKLWWKVNGPTIMKKAEKYLSEAWDAAWPKIKKALGKLFDKAKKAIIEAIKGPIRDAWNNLKKTVSEVWQGFKDWLDKKWENLKAMIKRKIKPVLQPLLNVIKDVKTAISGFLTRIGNFFSRTWGKIKSFFQSISDKLTKVKNDVAEFVDSVVKFFKPVTDAISTAGRLIFTIFKVVGQYIYEEFLVPLGNWFGEKIDQIKQKWEDFKVKVEKVLNVVKSLFTKYIVAPLLFVKRKMGEAADYIKQKFEEKVMPPFRALAKLFRRVATKIKDLTHKYILQPLGKLKSYVSEKFAAFKKIVKDKIITPIIELKNKANKTLSDVKAFFYDSLFGPAGKFGKWFSKNVIDPISNLPKKAKEFLIDTKNKFFGLLDSFTKWGNKAIDILTQPGKSAKQRLIDFKNYLIRTFDSVIQKIKSPFIRFGNWIGGFLSIEKFKKLGSQVVDGLMDRVNTIKEKLVNPFKNAWAGIKNFFKIGSPSKLAYELGGNISEGLEDSLEDMPKDVATTFKELEKTTQVTSNLGDDIGESLTDGLDESLGTGMPPIVANMSKTFNEVKTDFEIFEADITNGLRDAGEDAGEALFEGFANAFEEGIPTLTEKLTKIFEDDTLSEKMAERGEPLGEKFYQYIVSGGGNATKALLDSFQNVVNKISSYFAVLSNEIYLRMKHSLERYVQAYGTMRSQVQTIDDIAMNRFEEGGDIVVKLTKLLFHTQEAAGKLLKAEKDIKEVGKSGGVIKALSNIKHGRLEVMHNMPNTTIKISVSMDARAVAKAIVTQDIGKTDTSPQHFVVGPEKPVGVGF